MQKILKITARYASMLLLVVGMMVFVGDNANASVSEIQDGVDSIATGDSAGASLTDIIQTVINAILFVVGIVAVIMIIIGGFRYVASGGDSSAAAAAKNTILYAVIGLVVAIAAFAIVNFVLDAFI